MQSSASIGAISTSSRANRPNSSSTLASVGASNALTICGSCAELAQALPLRDALGTEGDADLQARFREALLHPLAVIPGKTVLRRTSVCPSRSVRDAGVDRAVDRGEGRIQVLVDRCADDQDEELAIAHEGGRVADDEVASGDHAGEHLVRSLLEERHAPAADELDRALVDVEDRYAEAALGEHDRERQADVAAAADDADVPLEHGVSHGPPFAACAPR